MTANWFVSRRAILQLQLQRSPGGLNPESSIGVVSTCRCVHASLRALCMTSKRLKGTPIRRIREQSEKSE